jgi:phthalate 4,5-dioxygenase reductase subunit
MTDLTTAAGSPEMALRVATKLPIAQDVVLFDLVPEPGVVLPAFSAGAHVVVRTPAGLRRQYSLCNAPAEVGHYRIAVKREAMGQGGSRSMVDDVRQGQVLQVSPPANDFLLQEAAHTLLVAGGIGITPILAMAYALAAAGRAFQLIYCVRSPEAAPFRDVLSTDAALAPHTTIHHDYGDRARSFDFAALLQTQPAGTHVYCCGPAVLMHAVRMLTRGWPVGTVHFEEFTPVREQEIRDGDAPIIVKLAGRGISVEVPVGMSILQVLRDHGQPVSSSCEGGSCGSCRTAVLRGVPDHRCYVMDADDNSEIMLCVSRARTRELVLDL